MSAATQKALKFQAEVANTVLKEMERFNSSKKVKYIGEVAEDLAERAHSCRKKGKALSAVEKRDAGVEAFDLCKKALESHGAFGGTVDFIEGLKQKFLEDYVEVAEPVEEEEEAVEPVSEPDPEPETEVAEAEGNNDINDGGEGVDPNAEPE